MMLSYDYTSKYICWFFQLNYLSRCKFPSKVFVWRKHDGVRQYTWKSVQLWRPTDFSVVKPLCIYNIYTGLLCDMCAISGFTIEASYMFALDMSTDPWLAPQATRVAIKVSIYMNSYLWSYIHWYQVKIPLKWIYCIRVSKSIRVWFICT